MKLFKSSHELYHNVISHSYKNLTFLPWNIINKHHAGIKLNKLKKIFNQKSCEK